jgi:hypothetical protein
MVGFVGGVFVEPHSERWLHEAPPAAIRYIDWLKRQQQQAQYAVVLPEPPI